MVKKSKYVVRCGEICSNKWCDRRERVRATEERKYIRGKRRRRSLPEGYDTQFLPMCKSWKWRVKKAKQWIKHQVSKAERLLYGISLGERKVMYHGQNVILAKGEYYIYADELGNVYSSDSEPHWYGNGFGFLSRRDRMIKGIEFVGDYRQSIRSYIDGNR